MAIETQIAASFDRAKLIQGRSLSVRLVARRGSTWDVASAAQFQASDEARFKAGAWRPVDGGQSAMIG